MTITETQTKKMKLENQKTSTKMKDERYPYFVGKWKRSIPYKDTEFAHDSLDEPHIKRRIAVLERYPQINQLYGVEIYTQLVCFFCVAVQVTLAAFFGLYWTETYLGYFLSAYFIGGSITQMVGGIMHECTHNLVSEDIDWNKVVALFSNIILPFPIAMSFRRYHLEHHAYQGVEGKDPDLPLSWEITLIKGNTLLKFCWLFFYPAMYVVRGAVFGKTISRLEWINIVTSFTSDLVIYHFFGYRGLAYLFVSLWLGYGIHPAAAHFIQEHYTMADGQETYSYYGWMNLVFLNIGYHNEHHDFPKVPWSKLPIIKATAPEFYNDLTFHNSWIYMLWVFLTSREYGPQSRVSRSVESHKKGRRMIKVE